MDVFISWSGKASHKMAETLAEYLPTIIQEINPFISTDIKKGSDWDSAISKSLKTTKCGVFCITSDNTKAPWLLFEAGAISVNIDNSEGDGGQVMTLLLDVEKSNLDYPLARFQATSVEKQDFFKMLASINQLIENPLSDTKLKSILEKFWPEIKNDLNDAVKLIDITISEATIEKTNDDMLKELIESNRSQNKSLSNLAESITRLEFMNNQGINKRIINLASEKDKINDRMKDIEQLTQIINEDRKNPYKDD